MKKPGFYVAPCMVIREDGTEYPDDGTITIDQVFEWQKKGEVIRTSQPPPAHFYEAISNALETYNEVLILTITKELSGTYQSAKIAADMFDDANIVVHDTKGLSVITGLLVTMAVQLRENGYSIEEILPILDRTRDTVSTFALFDSLHYLRRSGRINWSQEYFGTIMGTKPILEFTTAGVFKPYKKVFGGRKRALKVLVKALSKRSSKIDPERLVFLTADLNTIEDLRFVVSEVRERLNPPSYLIGRLGSILASHGGPGVLAAAVGELPEEISSLKFNYRL